jgi:hypothetical protein
VTSGQTVARQDFGLEQPITIKGQIFLDPTTNGVYEPAWVKRASTPGSTFM